MPVRSMRDAPGAAVRRSAGLALTIAAGAFAMLLPHAVPGQAGAQPPDRPIAAESGPAGLPESGLRVGMVHSQPHLCAGQEPGQRDLRVLRLAYGVALTPARRVAWPWYLATHGREISLRAGELWGGPAVEIADGQGRLLTVNVLVRWLAAAQTRVPGVRAERAAGTASSGGGSVPVLTVQGQAADPWLASRFNGSALLPYREEFGVAQPCRSWPAGVEFLPRRGASAGVRYAMRSRGRQGVPAFALTGYGSAAALWQDFGAGRLDVALVDGDALRAPEPPGGLWGAQPGTQQIVLRWSPKLSAALTPEAREVLSLAINRPALAGAAGRGAFRAARAFLEPVLAESSVGEAEALRWDSRQARRQWLAGAGASITRRLRFEVLAHPILEAIAKRLAGQWQTTLGVAAVPEPLEADRLAPAWNGGGYDLLLDVVDLDDGSLQDLWNATLASKGHGTADPPGASQLAEWETELRRSLPYLPLLTNMFYVLARGEAAAERIRRLCPACSPGAPEGPTGDN